MTRARIEEHHGSRGAAVAYKDINVSQLQYARATLPPGGGLTRTLNAAVRAVETGLVTVSDLASQFNRKIMRTVDGISRQGIRNLDWLLTQARIRRIRDMWSQNHHGLIHPDDHRHGG